MRRHPNRKPARRRAPWACRWLAPILTLLVTTAAPSGRAHATPITTAANLPYSAFAPGGVNMATGELILVMKPDLELAGPMPIVFQRYYGSMLSSGSSGSGGSGAGHLGPNWLGSFDWSLSLGPLGATITTNEGQQLQFQPIAGGWMLVSPTDQDYTLSSSDFGLQLTDPSRHRVYMFNASSLLLQTILDDHGNGLNLFYSGGQLMQVSDGSGHALSFDYDFTGLLRGVSDGTRSVSFAYSGGVLASATDAAGRTTSYAYTGSGALQDQLQSLTEPLGNVPMTWAYDAFGRVTNTTDAFAISSSFGYDLPAGNTWTDALGHTWTYAHDPQGRLTSELDPAGGTTSFTYDGLGRLASSMRPLGDVTSFAYDPTSGYLASTTCGDGSVYTFTYAGHGVAGATLYDVASARYPDGASESFGRDGSGNLTDWTDRGGLHWTATYNFRGEPLSLTNPTLGTTTWNYDTQGYLTSETDNAGHTTSFVFDAFGRLTKITWGNGSNRQFAYDPLDHLTTLTDEGARGWTYDYDPDGRLATATDPLIEHEGFVYDAGDRLTQVVDGLGHASTLAYDGAGRLASSTDRTGIATQYQYDMLGRLIHVTDPAGGSAGLSYDGNGRVPAVQDALGRTTSYQYDSMDRITHLTDPAGAELGFVYDAMGRALSATGSLGRSRTMSYDARGLLTASFDATSETDFPRTALGQIAQMTDPNRNAWPASYDGDGRVTSSADPLGRTTSYVYDAASRLTQTSLPIGPTGVTEDDGFNDAWEVSDQNYSDGTVIAYTWDNAGRLTGGSGAAFAYDAAGRMTSSNGLAVARDAEGRVTSETYGPSMVVSYAYDGGGRLASVTDWLGGSTTFAYDTTGALVSMVRPNGTSAAYQYDGAGRLADLVEKQPGPPNTPALAHIAITRDVLGQPVSINRTQPQMPGVSTSSSTSLGYDVASQVTGDTYDGLARLLSDGARQLQWDAASRLTSFNAGTDAPQFTYDALDRPLSRAAGTTSEQYVWNYAMAVPTLDVVNQGGVPKTFYVHAPSGLLLYAIDATAGGRTFFHYDENGNTIFLTDNGGAVQTKYAYSPFGEVTTTGPPSDNPFTLGGASGVMQLGDGFSWTGGEIYDSKTSRMISGGAINSGDGGQAPQTTALDAGSGMHWWGDRTGSSQPGYGDGSDYCPWCGSDGGPGKAPAESSPVRLSDIVQTSAFDAASGPRPWPWASAEGPRPWPWTNAFAGSRPIWSYNAGSLSNRPVVRQQAGTIMHELGHSLALSHAGSGGAYLGRSDGRLQMIDASPSQSFGKVKTDQNSIGNDDFGGGYSYGLGWRRVCPRCRRDSDVMEADAFDESWQLSSLPKNGGGAGYSYAQPDPSDVTWSVSGKLKPAYRGSGNSQLIGLPIGPQDPPSISDFCPWCVGR